MKTQAEKWVQRFVALGKKGCVNVYEFNEAVARSECRGKSFLEYNEEWLDFILACRNGSEVPFMKSEW